MKLLFAALSLLSLTAMANEQNMPCENDAQKIAQFINKSGWGEVDGYLPVTNERYSVAGVYIFDISIKNLKTKDTIGKSYKIVMDQDSRSQSCITLSLSSR